jgi:hypothetical protein
VKGEAGVNMAAARNGCMKIAELIILFVQSAASVYTELVRNDHTAQYDLRQGCRSVPRLDLEKIHIRIFVKNGEIYQTLKA